jgi:hypothetical protein
MVPLAVFLTVRPQTLDTVAGFVPAGWLTAAAGSGAGSCEIKGNIGEQWLCSESEARTAGWMKARR